MDLPEIGEPVRLVQEHEEPFSDGKYFEHIKKVNEIFYDQIKISDQKAAYIFTFILAFLISSTEGRGVFTIERYREAVLINICASAALALASVFSIICAIFVILPRRSAKTTTLFWGAWDSHRQGFTEAAKRGDLGYLFREYLDNADVLSRIARDKYRFVTLAFRGLVVTVLSYVVLLMVGNA